MVPENWHQVFHWLIYDQNKVEYEDFQRCKRQRIKSIFEDMVFASSSEQRNFPNKIRFGYEKRNRFKKF